MIIREVSFKSKYQIELIALRKKILRTPLGLDFTTEELEQESKQSHIAAIIKDTVVGGLILVPEENKYKLRQMCVSPLNQGQSIGSKLLSFSLSLAQKHNIHIIYCHARKMAIPFYQKNGFKVVGNMFLEVNMEHFRMEISSNSSPK